ncbi:MAG TPA: dTMP kinase [Xanthobacteraceae bacterium]|nr:dTMP kinase [Xanthobacteraceae bacterium]
MRGRFITFEGGEGAGKSTQIRRLEQRLRAVGREVLVTREPGGSPGAEAIRHILLSGAAEPLGAEAEAILFAAARDDHVRTVIEPALRSGVWVLCDRFADSTRAYQGILGKVDPRLVNALERLTVGETRPDLTFVLDVPPELGLQRAAQRRGEGAPDRFEAESLDFHIRLRAAFRAIAEEAKDRCVLVDASGDPEEVAERIWTVLRTRFTEAAPVPHRAATVP